SFQFSWIPYVSNNHLLDDGVYQDRSRWAALDSIWYATGRAYRSLDSIDGTPSPIFQRWLDHQGYDAYWQAMTPQGAQYAQLTIPVLSTTGYFDGAQAGALRYVRERMRITPGAEQYLLIGPWDHFGSQRRPSPFIAGYRIDPVALLDIHAITYQWFDHILRGGPRPAILADRFNFQVMGTNTWQHSATLAGMSNDSMTLYLTGKPANGRYQLARQPGQASIRQTVDLKDRTTSTDNSIHDPLADTTINTTNGLVFVSDPLTAATTITGSFTGLLRAVINKKDMDLGVQLYELTERGEYFQLSFFLGRASMARDRTRRRLLAPGVLQSIPIGNTRMVSAELPKGSRLVVVVNVNKDSQTPINYGTGKDVSRETIADAGVPLQIRWSGRSYITIPIRR
ncbi:MAG: CocE/NonD family hydrolase, partial [Gemmatimonadota bacterium]